MNDLRQSVREDVLPFKMEVNMQKKAYLVGFWICLLVFIGSIFMVGCHYISAEKSANEFDALVEMVEEEEEDVSEESAFWKDEQYPLEKYQELFRMNNDMYGWISIEGTNINYPVMYAPDQKDYYLKRNFEKEYSAYGAPYIAEHCNPYEPSDNIIIYGHHMNNGSMFSDLMKYEDKNFFLTQKTLNFDSMTEIAEYEIIAVFKTTAYDDTGFKYYLFTDAETKEEFDSYIRKCKELALYETGVSAEYGDQLITLSTCEYSKTNGRMVVVAKKVVEVE